MYNSFEELTYCFWVVTAEYTRGQRPAMGYSGDKGLLKSVKLRIMFWFRSRDLPSSLVSDFPLKFGASCETKPDQMHRGTLIPLSKPVEFACCLVYAALVWRFIFTSRFFVWHVFVYKYHQIHKNWLGNWTVPDLKLSKHDRLFWTLLSRLFWVWQLFGVCSIWMDCSKPGTRLTPWTVLDLELVKKAGGEWLS